MRHQYLVLLLVVMPILFFSKKVYPQEPLELKAIEGSHSVGHDQNNLGIRNFKKKKFNDALKHFHIASMADPKRAEIYFNIGLTLIKLGQESEAGKYFNLASKNASKNSQIISSKVNKLYNCRINKKKPCDFSPPNPFKIEGSGTHYLD
tara:strand:- start:942 stop:1388 length:447 start_codon:yes stop_codon:yes gene_type:complete